MEGRYDCVKDEWYWYSNALSLLCSMNWQLPLLCSFNSPSHLDCQNICLSLLILPASHRIGRLVLHEVESTAASCLARVFTVYLIYCASPSPVFSDPSSVRKPTYEPRQMSRYEPHDFY